MGLMDLFKKKSSGDVAKDRLKLLLVSDRANCSPEMMEMIKRDIIQVISKYMDIDADALDVKITETESDSNNGMVPALFANIPIKDMKQNHYGGELGAKFKLASFLDIKLIGTISEAKITNNSKLCYMKSTDATLYGTAQTGDNYDYIHNKGMRDSGTPLTAATARAVPIPVRKQGIYEPSTFRGRVETLTPQTGLFSRNGRSRSSSSGS